MVNTASRTAQPRNRRKKRPRRNVPASRIPSRGRAKKSGPIARPLPPGRTILVVDSCPKLPISGKFRKQTHLNVARSNIPCPRVVMPASWEVLVSCSDEELRRHTGLEPSKWTLLNTIVETKLYVHWHLSSGSATPNLNHLEDIASGDMRPFYLACQEAISAALLPQFHRLWIVDILLFRTICVRGYSIEPPVLDEFDVTLGNLREDANVDSVQTASALVNSQSLSQAPSTSSFDSLTTLVDSTPRAIESTTWQQRINKLGRVTLGKLLRISPESLVDSATELDDGAWEDLLAGIGQCFDNFSTVLQLRNEFKAHTSKVQSVTSAYEIGDSTRVNPMPPEK